MIITSKVSDNKEDYTFVRQTVFVEEQGFHDEFDEIDAYATHVTIYGDGELIGCARLFPIESGEYKFGRIAILKKFRKQGYGAVLMSACEENAKKQGASVIILDAQTQAQGFYETQGYIAYGDIHLDEGEPHIYMKKSL